MDDAPLMRFPLPEGILQPLFNASNLSTLDKGLEILIEVSKTASGRLDLSSKNILPTVLRLIQSLSYPSGHQLLLLSLKLLRNLCAGEIANQSSFIEHSGIKVVSIFLTSVGFSSDSDWGIICMGLQVLGNVSLAGAEHQRAVWQQFFPDKFVDIARIRKRETCDPLCMVIYTCCEQSHGQLLELCQDRGLPIMAEIVHTASAVGFGEDWFKLLLSRVCIEEFHFPQLFSKLCLVNSSENCEDNDLRYGNFSSEQAFLLSIVSEILNERVREITVYSDFALCVLEIFKRAVGVVDFFSRGNSGLPTGFSAIDVLGYSLTILRDICALGDLGVSKENGSVDVVDMLVSLGLLELLLCLLQDLEPPTIIRKATKEGENKERTASYSKLCPYKGFRRDIVAVIGNCAYCRKHVQDELRRKNGMLLLLQQCVTDEDNPFLREWGIWSVRNLLEGNAENQQRVAELELQGSVDVPELAGLGLRVEVDQRTRRAKLVNVP